MIRPNRSWLQPLIRFLELRSAARRSLALADGGRYLRRRPDADAGAARDADAAGAAAGDHRREAGCCHV